MERCVAALYVSSLAVPVCVILKTAPRRRGLLKTPFSQQRQLSCGRVDGAAAARSHQIKFKFIHHTESAPRSMTWSQSGIVTPLSAAFVARITLTDSVF